MTYVTVRDSVNIGVLYSMTPTMETDGIFQFKIIKLIIWCVLVTDAPPNSMHTEHICNPQYP